MSEIKRWSGLRNTDSPERLKQGELTVAENVDINNSMKILSRQGQTVINATASHSLYADGNISLLAQGSTLYRVNADLSLTALVTLTSSNDISYATLGSSVYYSNGVDKGIIRGQTPGRWGVTPPTGQPIATRITGTLPAGKYMYAITYLRNDGHESGTGLAGVIEVVVDSGIRFEGIEASTDASVYGIILYVSTTNGEVLYQAAVVLNGVTAYEYRSDTLDSMNALQTQFCEPPPAGTIVREFSGAMYVVVGNMVYFSEPYAPELFRLDTNFHQFLSEVVMFECVNSGIYVGTRDETGYISDGKYTTLFDYGVLPGTAASTVAAVLETNYEGESRGEQAGLAVMWATKHGICAGREGGTTVNLTEVKYSFPDAQIGAALVRQSRGFTQYITCLRGAGELTNAYEE